MDSDKRISVNSAQHPNMYQTLDLLALDTVNHGRIYFVVEGCADDAPLAEVRSHHDYLYKEHSCPTNFVPVAAVMLRDDDDPHGVFEYIDTVWMTESYVDARSQCIENEWIRRAFPQISE